MKILDVSDLHVRFPGDAWVLRGLDLRVAEDERIAIVGESGCGKTTLLRCLTDELRPVRGEVRIGNWTPGPEAPPPGLIGMVWQDPAGALDPLWTIGACIAEPLRAAGHSHLDAATGEALSPVRLGLSPSIQGLNAVCWPGSARVARPRACSGPMALIADEPTSSLNPTNAATIVRMLYQASRTGTAVLVLSHNLLLLQSFWYRIVTMGEL